jgi:hypothetical protein
LIYAAFLKPGPLGTLLGPTLAENRPKTKKNLNILSSLLAPNKPLMQPHLRLEVGNKLNNLGDRVGAGRGDGRGRREQQRRGAALHDVAERSGDRDGRRAGVATCEPTARAKMGYGTRGSPRRPSGSHPTTSEVPLKPNFGSTNGLSRPVNPFMQVGAGEAPHLN